MGKNPPKVSIGLPVFNGENYLSQAVESLLAQTFTDFELIISDNGSTDRTRQICEAYAARDPRIRYYRHDKNVGAARNFNFTVEQARGQYFKWAAHDDMCAPEFLARCVAILDGQAEAVLCYSRTVFIDNLGQVTGYYSDNLNLRSSKASERLHHFFTNPGWCHPVFGLMRKDILQRTQQIGNFPRSDRNLLGELALYGQFYEIPENLFLRRLHPQISTSANKTEGELAAWFDPLKKGKMIFPRWRRVFEYFRAITRAPLSLTERGRCYLEIAQFTLLPQKWLGIAEDLFNITKIASRSKLRNAA